MSTVLPVLDVTPGVHSKTQHFVSALRTAGFIGDLDLSYSGRLVAATDNSIYQQLPQAVIYPKAQNDVALLMRIAAKEEFQEVAFAPRGGGTGTNGQSLTPGIVIDLSRYLTRILELNLKEGWVRVEAGLVKDALNEFLAPHGYFFAPDTSTSNRATIGGMIATDASGQGSLVYGKTSDHVLGLRSFLTTGVCLESTPVTRAEAEELAREDSVIGRIYQQVIASCVNQRQAIEEKFPPLNRFLTGYDLKHAWNPQTDTVDISRLLTGAEGTLALVTEAKLSITPIPREKVLVNVKYQDFQAALRHAPSIVKANATSVETIDSKVLNLAREDIIWHEVRELLTDVEGFRMDGINMVEFTAIDADELNSKLAALCAQLDQDIQQCLGVIGYQICRDNPSIQRIYAMRKKAVGLLGATKGRQKPVAFVEDTAVPPEKLADFIAEFRALLDSEGLHYGMFGHVDAGVLHVRPALDLTEEVQEQTVRRLSDQVVQLTAKYGGLMWGEHGKGYRSEYGPEFFGEQLFSELRRLKTVFDPLNRLNPGKICTPIDSAAELVSVDARKRGWFDRQIPIDTRETWQGAMDCNGNGLCFNFDVRTPMCPSYRGTGDRRNSPKGRASLLREWLRLNAERKHDLSVAPTPSSLPARFIRSISKQADFSHEVRAAMDSCLACKACTTQCPVSVDIPKQRSRFYTHYYSRYMRPLKDYLVRDAEAVLPKLARYPRLSNILIGNPMSRFIQRIAVGYVDTPEFAVPSLTQRLRERPMTTWAEFEGQRAEPNFVADDYVVIIQDAFTHCFEPELIEAMLDLIHVAGKVGVVMPYQVNGKGMHVKGFMPEFKQVAEHMVSQLRPLSNQGVHLIGVDAATTLCFRDEYIEVLGDRAKDLNVKLPHEWLLEHLPELSGENEDDSSSYRILSHCTEQTALPSSKAEWQTVFKKAGLVAQSVATGCCGMAGSFGHEADQQATSRRIYGLNWEAEVKTQGSRVLATGFSCRCQVKRYSQVQVVHPLEILAARYRQTE
ncbi:MAG: FAD-binding oxidoreductase [Idiomarina sp.]|nr:FAD-binding oxidoreductase [Idiomarina sp.]